MENVLNVLQPALNAQSIIHLFVKYALLASIWIVMYALNAKMDALSVQRQHV